MSHFHLSERPPATLSGAITHGLLRLAVAVGVASGIAYLISWAADRGNAFGFYIVGAVVLVCAFATTGTGMGSTALRRVGEARYNRAERERRFNMSFAYMLVGALVAGIGIAIDLLSH